MKTFAFKPITYYRVVMWFFVAVTMCAIFFFSAQTGEQSSKASDIIVTVIENQLTPSQPATATSSDVSHGTSSAPQTPAPNNNNLILTTFVRKVAHVLIFAALGFFLYGAICSYNGKRTVKLFVSIAIGILYAATDELHQYFIEGRNATIRDVFIDSFGIVIGVCFMLVVVLIIKSIRKNKALGV